MRIAACALSAVLMSGCSWFGGYGPSDASYQSQGYYGNGHNAVNQGGFPQHPDFANGYTTGGYGSHADTAGHYNDQPKSKKPRKPKLRGVFSLGFEKSVSGALLDYSKFPGINPEGGYNPANFNQSTVEGSVGDGLVTDRDYTATTNFVNKPALSFDDVYSTPTRISAGLEYILSPKATLFANAGYSHAQGEAGSNVSVEATLLRTTSAQSWDPGPPSVALGPPVVSTSFIPNVTVAEFEYNFNDMQRYDFEVGGRYYFDPIVKDQGHRTLTPFVSVSAGVSHYNDTNVKLDNLRQLSYERAFESNLAEQNFYNVQQPEQNFTLYDAQWVPSGALLAGMEWQLTPGAALALETGFRYENARNYSNGESGEKNIAVPLTLRGSFNF